MFENTRAVLDKTVNDFKRFIWGFALFVQLFYIGYLAYAVFFGSGNKIVNISLLVISIGYFVFYVITYEKKDKHSKELKRTVKRALKWYKISASALTLVTMIYGIYTASENTSPFSLILVAIMVIVWVMQVIFELAYYAIEARVNLFKSAFEVDVESIKKPVTAIGDFVKRIKGEEVEASSPHVSEKKALDKIVSSWRAKRQEEKAAKKKQKEDKRKKATSDDKSLEPVGK